MQQFHLPFRREKPFIPIRINISNNFPSLTIPGYNSYYDINAIIFSPSTLLPFIIQIQYTRIIGRLNFVNRSSSIRNVVITLFVRARQRAVVEILFSKVKKRLYLGREGGEGREGVKILDAYYHLTREMKRVEEKPWKWRECSRSVLNVREYFVSIPTWELYHKVEKKWWNDEYTRNSSW